MPVDVAMFTPSLFTQEQLRSNIGKNLRFRRNEDGASLEGVVLDIVQRIDEAGRPFLLLTIDDSVTT